MRRFLRYALAGGLVSATAGLIAANGVAAASKKADTASLAATGQQVFQRQCAPCHGQGPGDDGPPTLPGTAALQRKYQGELPAALEKRSDLTAETIRFFVRSGSGAMPSFRKAELSDADIDAIAAYLHKSALAK